jgi:hypothetical protein
VAAKEVYSYVDALHIGWTQVQKTQLLTNADIIHIQSIIEKNNA